MIILILGQLLMIIHVPILPSGTPCWNVTFQECVATQTPGQQGNYTACITIGGSQPNTTTNSKFRIVHSGNYQAGPGTPSYVNPYGYTDYKIISAESTPTYTSNPVNYPVGTCSNKGPRESILCREKRKLY
jgi:hypothetical protein